MEKNEEKKNKVEKIQLANLASLGSLKALLGMHARLPWGRRDMSGAKHGGVYVEYVLLIQVSVSSITIPCARTKNLPPPWGFCILAFAQGAGICWDSSQWAGICL